MPVTAASVRIGVPIAPNATGAVLAMSDSPAAYSGVNPRPISSAEQIATGVPNPDAPSMNAPNENATSSAWMRRSARQTAHRVLDDLELPGRDGQAVEKDRVEDDPADRQEAVSGAVDRRRRGGRQAACRTPTTDTASADDQPGERRTVRTPLEHAERDEQEDDGQRRGRRAEPRAAERVVALDPGSPRHIWPRPS